MVTVFGVLIQSYKVVVVHVYIMVYNMISRQVAISSDVIL